MGNASEKTTADPHPSRPGRTDRLSVSGAEGTVDGDTNRRIPRVRLAGLYGAGRKVSNHKSKSKDAVPFGGITIGAANFLK